MHLFGEDYGGHGGSEELQAMTTRTSVHLFDDHHQQILFRRLFPGLWTRRRVNPGWNRGSSELR